MTTCSRTADDLVLDMGFGGPRGDVALVEEGEEVVTGNQRVGWNSLERTCATVDLPAPGGPVTTIKSATGPWCLLAGQPSWTVH